MFPSELSIAIAECNVKVPRPDLARAATDLSSRYRDKRGIRPSLSAAHRAAYLNVRMPATYAVTSRVLAEARVRVPGLRLQSMLDLGAGPGTAMWAAAEQFPDLDHIVLMEDSCEWIEIGKHLCAKSGNRVIANSDWRQGSITGDLPKQSFDLVAISYVMNEIAAGERTRVAMAAWQRTNKLLVIMEPGTPVGFAGIRTLRQELINSGAYIVAPCPHANQCPIAGSDWCHFSERLERSSEHRHAKDAELGYEDEKYSYVIFSREQVALPAARILRHPRKHSGHVEFDLCTTDGLKRETISHKQGERYKSLRKAKWGETP